MDHEPIELKCKKFREYISISILKSEPFKQSRRDLRKGHCKIANLYVKFVLFRITAQNKFKLSQHLKLQNGWHNTLLVDLYGCYLALVGSQCFCKNSGDVQEQGLYVRRAEKIWRFGGYLQIPFR